MAANGPLLEVRSLRGGYGRGEVLHGIDFTVDIAETTVILGANGAGKTSLLRALSGVLPDTRGTIAFDGVDISRHSPARRAATGIAHVPQGRGTFAPLSVEDNLRVGAVSRRGRRFLRRRPRGDEATDMAYELFPALLPLRRRRAGLLSGGEQQMLAVARALISGPRLLLLDEPSLGLSPMITSRLYETFATVRDGTGVAMVVVEQSTHHALALATTAHLIEVGEILVTSTAEQLRDNEDLTRAYLGYDQ